MDGGGFVVSADALIRILVFMLYLPVCLITYRLLFPRLSPTSRRLASAMLVAQLLTIVLALQVQPTSVFERWVWDLNEEWNIPTTLATMQLASVIGVALLTACLARARPVAQRLYLLGTGLVVLVFLLDEHLRIHEITPSWVYVYIVLGAALALATLVLAMRSPQRERIWHICLLVGLALSGFGAVIVDKRWSICDSLGFLRLDGCLFFFPLEESMELLGIWLVLVAMLGLFTNAVPTPSPRVRLALYALPAVWIFLLLAYALFPRLELRLLADGTSLEFNSGIHLRGYHIQIGRSTTRLQLYASARQPDYIGLGYSIHLVDQVSGKSVASLDKWADRNHSIWFFGPEYVPVYRQSMEVVHPPQSITNRALWIVLSLWRKKGSEFVQQGVLESDHQLLGETQVVLGELVFPAKSAATSSFTPIAEFDSGFTLEEADLPDHAQPGETLAIPFFWRSDVDGSEDFVQFLHFGHEESGESWSFDQQPLGVRLPTRLWYSGLADSELWQVPLPSDPAPGRYSVFTGLYRLRDQERLPVNDVDGIPFVDARVPLGILIIE